MAITRDFSGLRAFSPNFARDRIEEVEIPQLMVKCAARFGAPKPSYGHFSHPAGHGRGRFLSRKTPKMAIIRDFPGLRAFSANFARDRIEEVENPQPTVETAALYGDPKPSYGHFSHPAGHGWGRFLSRKSLKMAINRDFRGYVHFQQILRETESKRLKFPSRWSKVPRFFGPLYRVIVILVTRPRPGEVFKPKHTQKGNKSRFPGATCIFSKFLQRQKRRG